MSSRDWRGESYTPIDAQRIGDGQNDTLPVSTALCRAIYSNVQWLATEPRTVNWSPIIHDAPSDDVAGTRPYAMLNEWVSVQRLRIPIGHNASQIQLWGVWFVLTGSPTQSGNNDETPVKLRLWLEGVAQTTVELEQTRDGGWTTSQLGRDALTLDLDRPPAGEYVLDIAIRSATGLTTFVGQSSNVRLAGHTIEDENTSGSIFVDQTATNPDDQSLEVMKAAAGYSGLADYDLVGAIDRSGKISGATAVHVFGETPVSATGNSVSLLEISYLAPRTLTLRIKYDTESAGRILPAELRPNILVTGGATTRMALALREVLLRPRLLAIGSRGTLLSGDTDYTSRNYRRGWGRMYGDGAETEMWSKQVFLTTKNPTLRIRQWVSCLSLDTLGAQGARTKSGKRAAVNRPGRAAWDFRVVVDQLDDAEASTADWSTDATQYGEATETRVLSLTPTHALDPGPPLARTMGHIFESSYSEFAYREGQLVVDGGDLDVLQQLSIDVDLSGIVDADLDRPFRVRLLASHDTANTENDYMKLDDVSFGIGPEGWLQLISDAAPTITEKPDAAEALDGLNLSQFLAGRFIDAADWEKLRERMHAHWSRTGAVVEGPLFDPPWKTTSTTLTVTNEESGEPDLDTWAGSCVLQRLTPDDAVAAYALIEPAGQPSNGNTVDIGAKTYTWQTTLTDVDGNVQIGVDVEESLNNLRAAINLDAGAGTKYATSMTEHPDVTGEAFVGSSDYLIVTAKESGRAGNSIAVDTDWTGSAWNTATLIGGSEGTYLLEFVAYLQDCELELTWERFDARTNRADKTGTLTLTTSSGDSELVRNVIELDEAEAYEGDDTNGELAVFQFHVQGKTTNTTGYAWLWIGHEQPEALPIVTAETGTITIGGIAAEAP